MKYGKQTLPTGAEMYVFGNENLRAAVVPQWGPQLVMLQALRRNNLGKRPVSINIGDYAGPNWRPDRPALFLAWPLVNRAENGQVEFEGRKLDLKHHDPHALHFHFGVSSDLVCADGQSVALRVVSAKHAAHFPWFSTYEFEPHFSFDNDTLNIVGRIRNTGQDRMPVGMVSHPMFRQRHGKQGELPTMQFDAEEAFVMRPDCIPTGKTTVIGEGHKCDYRSPRRIAAGLDDCVRGWKRRAVFNWPEEHIQIVIGAVDPYSAFFQVWRDAKRDVFAGEPQTGVANNVNMAAAGADPARVGMLALDPGQEIEFHHQFRICA